MMIIPKIVVEDVADAARPCLTGKPYQMIMFERINASKLPVYFVGGVAGGPWSAQNALTKAHAQHGGDCFYCKKPIAKDQVSIDHVEPKTLGGTGSLQNLLICHKSCNQHKGHKPIEAFHPEAGREWLQALLKQVQSRLNRLPNPPSPPQPSPGVTGDP